MDCLFCKIIAGTIPAKISYSDEKVIAFDDINPQAPVHKIIIPRQHIATVNDVKPDDCQILGHMIQSAAKIAKELDIAENGYRLLMNCNAQGGQTVFHIHLHLIGGRTMHWPPG
jgi:histidine triad (HIT) family protein